MTALRIQIDAATDAALNDLAAADRTSKDALVRGMLEASLRLRARHDPLVDSIDADPVDGAPGPRTGHDPLDDLAGRYDEEPGDIDEIIYGRSGSSIRRS